MCSAFNLKQTIVSESYFVYRFLNNNDYFSRGNKKFFNVYKTSCYEIGDYFGVVVEKQGAFMEGGQSHNVLKLVSHDRKICTASSGFSGSRDGEKLYKELRKFLKNSLGYFEQQVIIKLEKIYLSNDYKNTLVFEAHNGDVFSLYFGSSNYDELEIICHK